MTYTLLHIENLLNELERNCGVIGGHKTSLPILLTDTTSRSSPRDDDRSAGREKFTSFVLMESNTLLSRPESRLAIVVVFYLI